jgi:adenylate cyclase
MTPTLDLTNLLPRARRAVLVCDVVESVRLMQEDEDGTVRRWQQLVDSVVREVLPAHQGRLVKSLGDGLMLEFAEPRQAVQAALGIQSLAQRGTAGVGPGSQMHLRVGVHCAEVVQDQLDIYGHGVNLTARIASLAGPGEIVVTADVRDHLVPVLDGDVEDLGDCHLKHVKEPVRAYRVGPAGQAPIIAPGQNRPLDLRPTIAVIPFAARGMEPGHALIGEAVADELIAALSKTAELHVISRLSTSAFSNRAGTDDANGVQRNVLTDVRQHLGATYVLSGRCTVIGPNISLFVELAEADGGRIVWAQNLKGNVSGLFSPEDDMLSRVVTEVSSAVMKHELHRAQNHALPNLEGFTLLMGAVGMMHHNSPANFDKPRQLLEHLIERSGRHPLPYTWLANWYVLKVHRGWTNNIQADTERALDCIKRALDIESNHSLALTIDGFVNTNLLGNINEGQERYELALAQNPNESLAWLFKGMSHAFKGEQEGEVAMANTEQALRLSPLDPMKYYYDSLAASASIAAGDYQRAIMLALRSLKANRMHTSTYRALALAYSLAGQVEQARGVVTQLLELDANFTVGKFAERFPGREYDPEYVQKLANALIDAGAPQ